MSNNRQIPKVLLSIIVLMLGLGLVSNVRAARILPPVKISGPGLGTGSVVISTTVEGNDNVDPPTRSNTLGIAVNFESADYIDFRFQVNSRDARDRVTEYWVTNDVSNNSGVGFSEFKLSLLWPTPSGLIPSLTPDGLDFDEEDYRTSPPTSTVFPTPSVDDDPTTLSANPDSIWYSREISGFVLTDGDSDTQEFRLDVPYLGFNIPQTGPPQTSDPDPVGYQFVLRMEPTIVPIPPAFSLLASALAAVGFIARRRASAGRLV